MSNEPTREDDEWQLAIMRALEDAGVEVITDGDMPTMLSEMLTDEFEQAAAERAWVRSKWDGRP
jgi:hypothetical protein